MRQAIEHMAAAFSACTCATARAEIGALLNRLSAEHYAAHGEVLSCGQWVKA